MEQELVSCRELNRKDLQEIEGHNIAIEAAMKKQEEMKSLLRQLVSDVQRVDNKSSETERLIEMKTRDFKQKEQ